MARGHAANCPTGQRATGRDGCTPPAPGTAGRNVTLSRYLRAHMAGADDDVLAAQLGIPHRQAVNQVCRLLASQGVIVRQTDPGTGKIVNRLVDSSSEQAAHVEQSTQPPMATRPTVAHLVSLDGEAELRSFHRLALLAHRQFGGLVLRLPSWVTSRLGLRFYFVRRTQDGGYQVGLTVPGGEADSR